MKTPSERNTVLIVALTAIVLFPATLWSWNVLAELFAGPQAQLKHILAVVILLIAGRRALLPQGFDPCRRGSSHEN